MSALSKSVKATIVAGLSAAALVVAPSAAMANGGNWAAQLGPTGQGCFAWTNWTSNHVTGNIYSQSGDHCYISILQWWRRTGAQSGFGAQQLSGSGTVASVPNNSPYYYYYGPSGNDYLCVGVYAEDPNFPPFSFVTYGDGC